LKAPSASIFKRSITIDEALDVVLGTGVPVCKLELLFAQADRGY